MLWIPFVIGATVANELITLSPTTSANKDSVNVVKTSSEEHNDHQLFIEDDIICNQDECYPKLFEAQEYWQEVRPEQQIVAGLDIRMDLETGLREAKLSSKPKEQKEDTQNSDENSSYEFSQDFTKIRVSLKTKDYPTIDATVDDLLEFSHDFKHGYKIVSHEFGLLKSLLMSEDTPLSSKVLVSSMLTACLRNNPPAVSYVQSVDPSFTQAIFREIGGLITGPPKGQRGVLVKRYLSIVQAMSQHSSDLDDSVLLRLCHWGDSQIKIRALETASLLFSASNLDSLQKRSSHSAHEAQKWVDEFAMGIQDQDVDELHVRNFLNSLQRIKQGFGKSVKVDSSFLNWLAKESEHRQQRLSNGLQERDLEQDEFDRALIDSRHLVFGNPLAQRIKRFDDEL
ncbi:LAFA_0A02146g1_1 [Lachancea sp. 'fantastica']|nr:LAFA_0A02146g1_1 [Lachancea sp. 'fantastica']